MNTKTNLSEAYVQSVLRLFNEAGCHALKFFRLETVKLNETASLEGAFEFIKTNEVISHGDCEEEGLTEIRLREKPGYAITQSLLKYGECTSVWFSEFTNKGEGVITLIFVNTLKNERTYLDLLSVDQTGYTVPRNIRFLSVNDFNISNSDVVKNLSVDTRRSMNVVTSKEFFKSLPKENPANIRVNGLVIGSLFTKLIPWQSGGSGDAELTILIVDEGKRTAFKIKGELVQPENKTEV